MKNTETTVNLIPSKARFSAANDRQKKKLLSIILLISGLMLGLCLLSLILGWQANMSFNKQKRVELVRQTQLDSYDAEVVLNQDMQYRLQLLTDLLGRKPYYGRTVQEFEKLLPVGVKVEKMDLDGVGKIKAELTLVGGEGMTPVENLIADVSQNGRKDYFFSKLSIANVIWDQKGWHFSMEAEK